MKNQKRLLLGVLSSLLFAVGFVSAANRLDPMTNDVAPPTGTTMRVADDCVNNCDAMFHTSDLS